MGSLAGKNVYLTGASRGIGRAAALRIAREGARLAICGRDGRLLDEVAREAGRLSGAPVFAKPFDLAREQSVLEFYAEAKREIGPPHILINNAGFNPRKAPLRDVTTEEFDSILAVNLRAPFILIREALKDMEKGGGGHIVNILSTVCHFHNEGMGAYTAAKWGLQGLAGVLRKEVRPRNIRVSSIYPGGVNTTFREKERPEYSSPESVAEALWAVLSLPEDLVVHDLTFRPMVETNF